MIRTGFYFILIISIYSCNSEVAKDSLCGVWTNEEEKIEITLSCDGTFTAINIPDDIDNCFLEYRGKDIQGNWNKSGADKIKLNFGRSSYCFLEIVNDRDIHLRMRTKIDSNLIIDLSHKK